MHHAGTERFAVSMLAGPETKTTSNGVVVTLFRWYPSEYKLAEACEELVVVEKETCATVREQVAAMVGGGLTAEHVGLSKKAWDMKSIVDLPTQQWDWDKAPPKIDYWKNTVPPDQTIGGERRKAGSCGRTSSRSMSSGWRRSRQPSCRC
eukprot:SAG22_NODE_6124_length_895_cov_2.301508_1_plen_150_part_00